MLGCSGPEGSLSAAEWFEAYYAFAPQGSKSSMFLVRRISLLPSDQREGGRVGGVPSDRDTSNPSLPTGSDSSRALVSRKPRSSAPPARSSSSSSAVVAASGSAPSSNNSEVARTSTSLVKRQNPAGRSLGLGGIYYDHEVGESRESEQEHEDSRRLFVDKTFGWIEDSKTADIKFEKISSYSIKYTMGIGQFCVVKLGVEDRTGHYVAVKVTTTT